MAYRLRSDRPLSSILAGPGDLAARTLLYLRRSRALLGLTRAAATAPLRIVDPTAPDSWEFSAFSSGGEDGIIDVLTRHLGDPEYSFLEIGASDGIANNTAWLSIGRKWRGVMVEGDPESAEKARRTQEWFNPLVHVLSLLVTEENAATVMSAMTSHHPDVFSLDVDGIDFVLARTLFAQGLRPGICVVEYNSAFGPDQRCAVDPKYAYCAEEPLYYGVSIGAWRSFFASHGYRFVGVERTGVNAFFVDENRFNDAFLSGIRGREFGENLNQQRRHGGTWKEQLERIDHRPLIETG